MKLYSVRYQLNGQVLAESRIPRDPTTMPTDIIIDNTWYLVADRHIERDAPSVVQCELLEVEASRLSAHMGGDA